MTGIKSSLAPLVFPELRLILLAFISMSGLAGCYRTARWTEDVPLSDGRVIAVIRKAQGGIDGDLGGPSGWVPTKFTLSAPDAQPYFPPWTSRFAPVLLDWDSRERQWLIVTIIGDCAEWTSVGKPQLPYFEFRSTGAGQWTRKLAGQEVVGRKANILNDYALAKENKHIGIALKEQEIKLSAETYRSIDLDARNGC